MYTCGLTVVIKRICYVMLRFKCVWRNQICRRRGRWSGGCDWLQVLRAVTVRRAMWERADVMDASAEQVRRGCAVARARPGPRASADRPARWALPELAAFPDRSASPELADPCKLQLYSVCGLFRRGFKEWPLVSWPTRPLPYGPRRP